MKPLGIARVAAALLAGGAAQAQTAPDPFVVPPNRPSPPGSPPNGLPPASNLPKITMEMLARQGFEVKAVERTNDRSGSLLLVLQRAGDIRICSVRLTRDPQTRAPTKDSACF